MRAEETLRRLARIRREARAILAARPAPALAQTMHTVERTCHLAAWQIGDATSLLPEGDAAERPAKPAGRKPATKGPVRKASGRR